jgi:hypothetical protein
MTDDLVGRNGLCYEWLYASYTSNLSACGLLVYMARTCSHKPKVALERVVGPPV